MHSEFSVACSALRDAVTFASMAIERRNTIPVLSYAKFHVADGKLTVSGTNLDQLISRTVDLASDCIFDAKFLLQPKPLLALLSQAKGNATIKLGEKDITIEADGVSVRFFNLLPVADWPEFHAQGVFGNKVNLSVALLNKVIQTITPCISTEETRYYLNGIFLQNLGGKLIAVATDGHRLGKYTPGVDWVMPSVILPRAAVPMITRALKYNQNGGVEIWGQSNKHSGITSPKRRSANGQQESSRPGPNDGPVTEVREEWVNAMALQGDGWMIRTKLIDGTFPDYTRVVPQPSDLIRVSIARHAVRRIFGSERSVAVKIDPEKGQMSSHSPDGGYTFTAPCQGHGVSFGINQRYLAAFTAIHDPIVLEGSSSGDPFRVLSSDPYLLWIIMPMLV